MSKKVFMKIENKHVKAFYILTVSEYLLNKILIIQFRLVPIKQRLAFSQLCRAINSNIKPIDIIKDSSHLIQKRIKYLEDRIDEVSFPKEILSRRFHPSKTAQNALNFLSTDSTNILFSSINSQEEVSKLFKLIIILLGRLELFDVNLDALIVRKILAGYNVENISNF
jgi:hypothetical protein